MSFLYPLFLLAAAAIAIPVLLHLYNLRRYQKVYFSHSEFLSSIAHRTQRMAKVRHWLLLLLRCLAILFLVLAFAQPIRSGQEHAHTGNLTVVYVDNSASMSLGSGVRTLLDISRASLLAQLEAAPPGSSFILVTNDPSVGAYPQSREALLEEVQRLDFSSRAKTVEEVFAEVEKIRRAQGLNAVDLWYYSDFRETEMASLNDLAPHPQIRVKAVRVQPSQQDRIYIDTAYLLAPVLKAEEVNEIVVVSRRQALGKSESAELFMEVNGQRIGAKTLNFGEQDFRQDTFLFPARGSRWQQIQFSLEGGGSGFDQDYYLSARSMPLRRILHLYQDRPNFYIDAAFRAQEGFSLERRRSGTFTEEKDPYNLMVIEGFGDWSEEKIEDLSRRIEQGQFVLLIPEKTRDLAGLNRVLTHWVPLRFLTLEEETRTLAQLQRGHPFIRDLFDEIPENVQLPTIHWHYRLGADFQSGQQALMSFSDGSPYLSRIPKGKGVIYLLSGGLDEEAGNFQTSYFFAPFLFQMAHSAGSGDVYALSLGSGEGTVIPGHGFDEKNLVSLLGPDLVQIPRQTAHGSGTMVYVDELIPRPGFYHLSLSEADTISLGANADRQEFSGEYLDAKTLEKWGEPHGFQWVSESSTSLSQPFGTRSRFPLWKLCVTLAGLMLLLETALLVTGAPRGKTTN